VGQRRGISSAVSQGAPGRTRPHSRLPIDSTPMSLHTVMEKQRGMARIGRKVNSMTPHALYKEPQASFPEGSCEIWVDCISALTCSC